MTWPDLGQQQSWEWSQVSAPSSCSVRFLSCSGLPQPLQIPGPSEVWGAPAQALLLPPFPAHSWGFALSLLIFSEGLDSGECLACGISLCIAAISAGLSIGWRSWPCSERAPLPICLQHLFPLLHPVIFLPSLSQG